MNFSGGTTLTMLAAAASDLGFGHGTSTLRNGDR